MFGSYSRTAIARSKKQATANGKKPFLAVDAGTAGVSPDQITDEGYHVVLSFNGTGRCQLAVRQADLPKTPDGEIAAQRVNLKGCPFDLSHVDDFRRTVMFVEVQ
jgi:hypothetical protein